MPLTNVSTTLSFSKVKHFKKQATYPRFYQSGSIHRDRVRVQQFCTSHIESDQDSKDISDGSYSNLTSVSEFILKTSLVHQLNPSSEGISPDS